jgi:hypothetical protein
MCLIFVGIGRNANERRTMLKSRLTSMVRSALAEITGEKEIKMAWTEYFPKIVRNYRVALVGWPNSTFDPQQLGNAALIKVIEAMQAGDCRWEKLDDEEFDRMQEEYNEHLEKNPRPPRKKRSDSGKRRKQKRVDSDEDIIDSGSD